MRSCACAGAWAQLSFSDECRAPGTVHFHTNFDLVYIHLLVYSDTSGDVFGAAVDRPGETIHDKRGLSFRHLDRGSEPSPIRRHTHFVASRKRGFAIHRASELDG